MVKRGICMLAVVIMLISLTGCTDSDQRGKQISVSDAAQMLLTSYQSQNQSAVLEAYGISGTISEKEQAEIDYGLRLFKAIGAEAIQVKEVKEIYSFNDYVYICASYDMVLNDGRLVPYLTPFIAKKLGDSSYQVLCYSDVPVELADEVKTAQQLMASDNIYKKYKMRYDYFEEQYPEFSIKVSEKMKDVFAP